MLSQIILLLMDKILLLTQKASLFNSLIITTTTIESIIMMFYSPVKQIKDSLIAQKATNFHPLYQACLSCSMCISWIKAENYMQQKVKVLPL